jgi:hypothetical protein
MGTTTNTTTDKKIQAPMLIFTPYLNIAQMAIAAAVQRAIKTAASGQPIVPLHFPTHSHANTISFSPY